MMNELAQAAESFMRSTVSTYQATYEFSESMTGYGMHYHEDYEFLFHGRNGDVFYVGCQAFEMQPYDLYIVPPFQVHSRAKPVTLTDYERMYLYITPAILQRLGQHVLPIKTIIDGGVRRHGYQYKLMPEEYEHIKSLVQSIKNCGEDASPYDRLEDRIRLEMLVCTVCRIVERHPSVESRDAASAMPMLDVLQYINTHFTEKLTLSRLGEVFSISKSYLAHEFSKCFNMSIYQYILMNRIILARQLIAEGEPMLSVAYRCGFNDYSNFLRAFTRHTGASPSAWQKNRATGSA